MKRVVLLALLVACKSGPAHVAVVDLPAQSATPQPEVVVTPREPLFPEDPSLDTTKPEHAFFAQETWTGASDWQQHCREWGFDQAREDEVRERINTLLAARGVHLPDKPRAKGIVVAMGTYAVGVVDHGAHFKVVVCTEGVAPKSAHDAFAARIARNADRCSEIASLGAPDVAWRRVHATGEIEIGLRFPHISEAASKRVIDAVTALHDARENAKMRGTDLWWTGLEKP
jgi:hypothetical protein